MAAAGAGLSAGSSTRPEVCVFTKPFAKTPWKDLGPVVRKSGAEAVELTVRPGGHVLPERVRDDLPRAVEALAAHGVTVPAITSAITSAAHPATRPILETAARLKIARYRLGYWRYGAEDPAAVIVRLRQEVRELVKIGADLNIQAGWHNHPGDNVGRSIWDTRAVIEDLDPAWIGYFYDVSHGYSDGGAAEWGSGLRLAMPRLKMVVAKDHILQKSANAWRRSNCPLGEGRVDFPAVFSMLAKAGCRVPISVAVEYDAADAVAAVAHDVTFIRGQITKAYGA
jgi:sugar phosphate isomerase/epimerase